jgi:hypothetical protein
MHEVIAGPAPATNDRTVEARPDGSVRPVPTAPRPEKFKKIPFRACISASSVVSLQGKVSREAALIDHQGSKESQIGGQD